MEPFPLCQKRCALFVVMLGFLTAVAAAEASSSSPYSCHASVCVGFTSNGGAEALVLDAVLRAQKTIQMAAYVFTSKTIAKALVDAKKRGVEIRIVLDKKRAGDRYSSATFLRNQGFAVRTLMMGDEASMHHKFMVVDGRYIQTGSFNYTKGAGQRNAENVIRLDDPAVAKQYMEEWERLWRLAVPMSSL